METERETFKKTDTQRNGDRQTDKEIATCPGPPRRGSNLTMKAISHFAGLQCSAARLWTIRCSSPVLPCPRFYSQQNERGAGGKQVTVVVCCRAVAELQPQLQPAPSVYSLSRCAGLFACAPHRSIKSGGNLLARCTQTRVVMVMISSWTIMLIAWQGRRQTRRRCRYRCGDFKLTGADGH